MNIFKYLVKRWMNQWIAKKDRVSIGTHTDIHINNKFEGDNLIGDATIISNCNIGYGTYIGSNCRFDKTIIGKYCALGSNIKVLSATHPTNTFVSIHPAFYSNRMQAGFSYVKESLFEEFKKINDSVTAIIGNDVWIGDDVAIMGGVTVSDGAIIGTGSIVTKNVPAYAIVVGSPAKIIRYRFSEYEIEKLLNIQWWNKSREWINDNYKYFVDVKSFLENIKE